MVSQSAKPSSNGTSKKAASNGRGLIPAPDNSKQELIAFEQSQQEVHDLIATSDQQTALTAHHAVTGMSENVKAFAKVMENAGGELVHKRKITITRGSKD